MTGAEHFRTRSVSASMSREAPSVLQALEVRPQSGVGERSQTALQV